MFGSVVMCEATSITTSATSTGYEDDVLGHVTDYYGYSFVITDDSADDKLFHATLTNTSTGYDPTIDAIAFNLKAAMYVDFNIINMNPANWVLTDETSNNAIKFDYVGRAGDKLSKGTSLTFDFDFVNTPSNPFALWTDTDESLGKGLGGGDDSGQVAVSFQKLGYDSLGLLGYADEGSDLLASNWEGGGGSSSGTPVPEPATMLLLGSGLIGIAVSGKKRFKKRKG